MKTSSVFIPVLFVVLLFIIVLPRLIRTQSVNAQILPATSIQQTGLANPQVSLRPVAATQPAGADSTAVQDSMVVEPDIAGLLGLDEFAAPFLNGKAEDVVVVSVSDRFTLAVVQQPSNEPAYVSSEPSLLTQFALPRNHGTTGLLAHNFLSGRLFSEIQIGDVVTIVRGDGSSDQFMVSRIEEYQALSPNSPYSQFIDLNTPGSPQLTSASLFNRIYTQPDQVVFQTCIAAGDEPSWGRLFVTATRSTLTSQIPNADEFISNN